MSADTGRFMGCTLNGEWDSCDALNHIETAKAAVGTNSLRTFGNAVVALEALGKVIPSEEAALLFMTYRHSIEEQIRSLDASPGPTIAGGDGCGKDNACPYRMPYADEVAGKV